jgi:hypothetical protein
MHPDISRLPSQVFYDGRLLDGPDMAEKTKQPWHNHAKFGTYRFFSVNRGREEPGRAKSLMNKAECQVAVALYTCLRKEFSSVDLDFRIGVVSMYRAQIHEMRRAFEQRFGPDIIGKIDFNTVDGFQGLFIVFPSEKGSVTLLQVKRKMSLSCHAFALVPMFNRSVSYLVILHDPLFILVVLIIA